MTHQLLQSMKKLFLLLLFIFHLSVVIGQTTKGKASYYAKKFEGRRTASGEKFSNLKMTAAHKKLPFGTKVKITNINNNKTVIVTINDRLPKKSKRIIDLSQAAAKELDFLKAGIVTVTMEILPPFP